MVGYPSRVVAAWSREGVGKMVVDQLGAFVARQASNCLVVLLGVGLPMWTAVVALMLPKAVVPCGLVQVFLFHLVALQLQVVVEGVSRKLDSEDQVRIH